MEDDVNRAIKQLETIAIKAMNSGYLDDAAKVMHIAEEIERVDKAGLPADGECQEGHNSEHQADEPAAEFQDKLPDLEQFDVADEQAENVVTLDRFRKPRQAVGQNPEDRPPG
jgi:hypothetical protein